LRLDIRRIDSIKQGTTVIGNRTRVRVVKNKVAPPFRTAEFDIMYNEGISREGSILDVAADLEIVRKSGAFFSYGDTRLGQGRENAKEHLRRSPDLTLAIERQIRQAATGSMPLKVAVGDGVVEDDAEFALPH
jgi:recombination protein RecA